MSARQFSYYSDWEAKNLACPKCGWQGTFNAQAKESGLVDTPNLPQFQQISDLVPSRLGPRHWGQFSSASVPPTLAVPAFIAITAVL